MVRRNEVWFAGFESPQTAFLLRGSTHHLLGATPKTQAPLISTRSMLFNFDTYTSKIWDSLASAPEKIRVEILAVRHQVLALTRLRSIPGTDEAEIPGFSIVTGSPIYVYCLERIDPTSSLTRELAAFASADAKVGAAEKSVRNQRPMPPIFA
jgi:hypothetical protein